MTIPTLRSPGELLATLPDILGFTPVESVVIVGIREGGGLGAIVRVDRDDCLVPDVLEPMLRAIRAHLARDGVGAVILVTYTREPVRVACDAADALRCALADDFARVDTWAVKEGRYFAPGCADVTCCPPQGTPVPAPLMAAAVKGRWTAAATHGAFTKAWGTAAQVERRRSARASDRWVVKRDNSEETWRRLSLELWQKYLVRGLAAGSEPSDSEAGKLIAGLTDVRVRDAVIVWLVPDSAQAVDDVLRGSPSAAVTRALDAILDPGEGLRLQDVQADALRRVLSRCVALSRRKDAAALLAVMALVEWWEGSEDAAVSLCDAACASEPGYRLADLVRATIQAGVVPGWLAQ